MIVAGIGYRSGATPADLEDALALTGVAPNAVASLDGKISGPLAALAQTLNLPLITLTEAQIAGTPTLTCSPRIKARCATGSLAEACALVAAGPGRFYWKWIAIVVGLLVLYSIERTVRTGGLFSLVEFV